MANERVTLRGREFDAMTEEEVAAYVVDALAKGEGGRIITPNVDILRLADSSAEVGAFIDDATLVVADGMPLVWASRLAGNPLPERVAGSNLIWTISQALGEAGHSIYLLGGAPVPTEADEDDDWLLMAAVVGVDAGKPEPVDGAALAAAELAAGCAGLRIAGYAAPPFGFDEDPDVYAETLTEIVEARPDFVFVGIGFPRQERVISDLRGVLPHAWFLGCGAAIGFVAGEQRRAPTWMQRSGLEWAHRLAQEPRRLASRYLRHDAPYAMKLLAGAALRRG
ncbi:N-acetylglucosaminyldiphosphoundecaprenol N-acetyl-beta-D-mannosaminyltransferase [Allocatelliglobosispora scoriae]|uniref:N-acetylglucosaminyldiphosphoundecaprenol N-acetyl-beta-D-mannosaminyltransferase n=1 Tax=Allocatelliglobosispora scoriae TaxID=643052 RepID=A0A841BVT8_9ACTN|nr:WecB/TagA/CpsF family glycosyltransferase [Allocatelliglobosispora scoriae]MBB5871596.1 N-acetylglucosaminyldiphosphoundecaprenol N-acetyl-beta-D-mannosaminyltransferase [Allocatelliglobosispora scoriae]